MKTIFTVSALCAIVDGEQDGADVEIHSVADLENAAEGEITFVEKPADEKFAELIAKTKASCLIVPLGADVQTNAALIRVKNPKFAFAKIAAKIYERENNPEDFHPTSIIADGANVRAFHVGAFVTIGNDSNIEEGARIYDGVRIGKNVEIGKFTVIHPNCVIYDNVHIGSDCVIHAGTVIGADGFGYVRGDDGYTKFPQIGTVFIDDEVEIGANSCVDRGALGETRIGRGTKIDNLVQIAHNVQIGERVIIASQTGISGSTVIESDAVIGGQVGMGDHARVKSGAIIGSQAGVLPGKIVRPGIWWGTPVQPLDEYKRQNAHVKGLARLKEEVKELKKQLSDLKRDE